MSPVNDHFNVADVPSAEVLIAAREAIVMVDEGQRIVMINSAAQQMFGCPAAKALGSDISSFLPLWRQSAQAKHVQLFKTSDAPERPVHNRFEIIGRRANGEEFQAEATLSHIEMGASFGWRCLMTALIRDVTEESGLREELNALKQRFQAIFELSPNAIWITEGETIVFANRACFSLFGARGGDHLLGKSIYELLRPESHVAVRQQVDQALAGNTSATIEERIARLDGSTRDIEIAVAALPDHGQTTVQMVITDITQRKADAMALARSQLELRSLSASLAEAREEERRRIARELHDELGQRLSALKMELSTLGLAPGYGTQDGRIASMLEMLDETVASVRRIAADLRPLMLDDLGLNAAIEWLARDAARRMGIEVAVRLCENDPLIGGRASIALYRMVQEALTNVARHARATDVRIELRPSGDELVLTIKDNGVGFPNPTSRRDGSFGLLGIRERAYMLGGNLELDNPPGGGARITVRLPIHANAPETASLVEHIRP